MASHTRWRIAILTFLATGLAVVLVANFTLGDKVVEEWEKRSLREKIWEHALGLLSSQL